MQKRKQEISGISMIDSPELDQVFIIQLRVSQNCLISKLDRVTSKMFMFIGLPAIAIACYIKFSSHYLTDWVEFHWRKILRDIKYQPDFSNDAHDPVHSI